MVISMKYFWTRFFRAAKVGLGVSCLLAILLGGCGGCGGGGGNSSSSPPGSTAPVVTIPVITTPVVPLPAGPLPTDRTLRVICVGDSITEGVGVANRSLDSYPAVLGRLLGAKYQVVAFGRAGATAMDSSALPYRGSFVYGPALASQPDIVVVALGTNDALRLVDQAARDDFARSYRQLLVDFRRVAPNARFYLCIPTAAFGASAARNPFIESTIAPILRQIGMDAEAPVIDLFALARNRPELFPDSVHPDEAGARLIAAEIQRVLLSTLPVSPTDAGPN